MNLDHNRPDHDDQAEQDTPAEDSPSRRARVRASLEERLARPAPTVWLSGQEAAEYVGVSWPTLRRILLDHDIPHIRMKTLWRIDVADLDEHLHRIANAR
jgi:excisionase family DNA binding protein